MPNPRTTVVLFLTARYILIAAMILAFWWVYRTT
jgi:hypothetical protein